MTAVEWLYDWMWTKDNHYFLEGDLALAFSQAKEMEKEQIMDAYKADLYPCSDEDAEQYYNETFKPE